MAWTTINRNFMKQIYSCEHSDKEMLLDFINVNGFSKMKAYESGQSIRKVLKQGGPSDISDILDIIPPFLDHSQYFKNANSEVACLTYNTYENIDNVRKALTEWTEKKGLEFEVYEPKHSWYYPKNTCFVVIHLPGVVIKLK